MNEIMEGQYSLLDPGTVYGKTCQEPSHQTAAKTSKRSLQSSSGSAKKTPLMCLCLTRASGPKPGASTTSWADGPLPIGFTMLNTGECRSDGNGSVYWRTSTASQPQNCCLTLNCGEEPRIAQPTKLSEILVEDADPKYRLSPRACQGILNRAARRGKELPPELKAALEEQIKTMTERSVSKETGSTEQTLPDVTEPDGDGGGATPLTQSTGLPSALTNRGYPTGGVTETVRAEPHGAYPMVAAFSSGQSEKARSLGYEEEKSPTLRGGEGGNQKPVVMAFAQNQRDETRDLGSAAGALQAQPGMKQQTYVMSVDCRNATEGEVQTTLQAKASGGQSLNCGGVVRVQACDVYNQTVDGETAATVTAAAGGANTSGPKVLQPVGQPK